MFPGCAAFLVLVGLISLQSAGTAVAATIRESLLCEAQLRLQSWYLDKDALDWPKERDGVELQISHEGLPCGGDNIPVTFGHFTVEGAEPEDVLNALADCPAQQQWDGLVGSVTSLGEWPEEQARGYSVSFVAHPFSDREVFQWQVINATDKDSMWVVFSTEGNQALHTKKERQGGAVAAQDCLAAYWVQRQADGTVYVQFTSQVNSHPFLLSTSFVFNLLWGKTVDYINALRIRAKLLAGNRNNAPATIDLPEWLYLDASPGQEPTGSPDVDPPFCECLAKPSQAGTDVVQNFEAFPAARGQSTSWPGSVIILPGLLVVGSIVAGKLVLRWSRLARCNTDAEGAGDGTLDISLEDQMLLDE